MSGPVRSSKKYEDFFSNNGLAKELLKRFPGTEWGLEYRSLGNKIGDLDKGKVGWWANNPEKAKCLAELLEISLEDLGLHGKAQKGVFGFPEFPEFPPLDLKREEPWRLAEEVLDPKQVRPGSVGKDSLHHWLGREVLGSWRPPHEMDWLCISDELHRQLFSMAFAATGRHEVVFAETLAEVATRLANPKPLIVSVSQDGGDEDLLALAGRPQGAGILIIAPFMLIERQETSSVESMGWESRTIGGLQGRTFDLTANSWLSGRSISRWTLKKLPDWRERLLDWVEVRLNRSGGDTFFSAQAVGDWLKRFDPLAVWFCSTSDVMQLCRLAHLDSEKRLPNPHDSNAGDRLVQLLFARQSLFRVFRIKQLAHSRWQRSDLPWGGNLSLDIWSAISADGVASVSRSVLDEIVSGGTVGERKKAADHVAHLLEAGNPEALLSSGLVTENRRGKFDFQHPTFAGLLIRDRLIEQVAAEPPGVWAMNCFDPGRRLLVDAALDVVSMECLVNAAMRVESEPGNSAQVIAASEALFVAIGKRIAKEEIISPSLYFIGRLVIQRLDLSDEWSLAMPWSRPVESVDEQLAWVSACWSWSLLPKAAVDFVGQSWLFPGWANELPEPPYWLMAFVPDKDEEQASPALRRFLEVAYQWAKELDAPIENGTAMLMLPFLSKAAQGGVPAESAWWKALVGQKWAESLLIELLEISGDGAARHLWPSFLAAEREVLSEKKAEDEYNFPYMRFGYSRVRFWLLRHLKPIEILMGLSDDDRTYLGYIPESLPPDVRAPLLQSLVGCAPVKWFTGALPFFERFGFHAAPALEAYLGAEMFGNAAAECLWRWNAERAASLLVQQGESISLEVRKTLFWHCPEQYFPKALEALSVEPALCDAEERKRWVRTYLPSSGSYAVNALALLDVE